jgi:hypothetical protein
MPRTFIFKKSAVTLDPTIIVMDHKLGFLVTVPEGAEVDYSFNKGTDAGQARGVWGQASVNLNIDEQYFTEQDLDELINFLTAARHRVIKLNSKLKG